jgi:hypothetical protein
MGKALETHKFCLLNGGSETSSSGKEVIMATSFSDATINHDLIGIWLSDLLPCTIFTSINFLYMKNVGGGDNVYNF